MILKLLLANCAGYAMFHRQKAFATLALQDIEDQLLLPEDNGMVE